MKKRIASLSLALALSVGLAILPVSAQEGETPVLPKGEKYVETLEYSADTWSYWGDYDFQDVTIKVTYDGYLGSFDATAYPDCYPSYYGDVAVVEKGSKVTFQIISNDPLASYNHLTNIKYTDEFDWCYDGGCMGAGSLSYETMGPRWPHGKIEYPNSMVYTNYGETPLVVHRVNSNTYEFTPLDGLGSVGFSSTLRLDAEAEAEFRATHAFFGFLYQYDICNVLAVDQDDITELATTGKALIAESINNYRAYDEEDETKLLPMEYPGALEALGFEAAAAEDAPIPPCTKTLDYAWYLPNGNPGQYDTGAALKLTLENPADVEQHVLSALVRKGSGVDGLWEVDYFNYLLAPKESVSQNFASQISLVHPEHFYWVNFDSVEELNQYKAATPFGGYDQAYQLDANTGAQWIADNFGLTQ